MTVREANAEDRTRWDDYVLRHTESTPYHLFAWGRAITEAYGHPMRYLIAEEGGRISGVLPLVYMKPPLIQGALVSLPYGDIGGSLADSRDIHRILISEALSLGRNLGVRHIEVRQAVPEAVEGITYPVTVQSHKVRMVLELPPSSGELINGFKSKLRSQLKKSEKNGLEFKWGGTGDLDDFFAVFSENMRALGSPVHSKDWFRAIMDQFRERARIGMVYSGKNPAGVGLILCHAGTVTIPWASTLRKYNHLSPNMLLYWSFLKYASDNGYGFFDFGRSTPGEGTYKFKEQWGAKPVELHWYYVNVSGQEKAPQAYPPNGRAIVENLWKRIPLPLANAIGPYIRRYISL